MSKPPSKSSDLDAFLYEHYKQMGPKWCSEETGIPYSTIRDAAKRLGLSKTSANAQKQIRFIKLHYDSKGPQWCAEQLGISYARVTNIASESSLAARRDPDIMAARKEFLQKHYRDKGGQWCADTLKIPYSTVVNTANRMGLGKVRGPYSPPSARERQIITEEYWYKGPDLLAEELGRKPGRIRQIAHEEGAKGFQREDEQSWSPSETRVLRELINKGSSFDQIKGSLHAFAEEHGLCFRSKDSIKSKIRRIKAGQ